jgi:hypothetical protein
VPDLVKGQLNSFYPKNHRPVSIWAAEIRNVTQVVTSFSGVSAEGLGSRSDSAQGKDADIVTLLWDKPGWPSGKCDSITHLVKWTFTFWNGFIALYGYGFIHLNHPADHFIHGIPPIKKGDLEF